MYLCHELLTCGWVRLHEPTASCSITTPCAISTSSTIAAGVSATPVELSHSHCDHVRGYHRETARMAGSYAMHSEMLQTENWRRKGTESMQCNKPLNGSRGKAPIFCYFPSIRATVGHNRH